MSTTVSVIIASAQSVAKVYVIGAVGYVAVLYPKKAPLLPSKAVGTVARFCFEALLIPLVFSTTAISVTPASLGDYWFVVVAAFVVTAISYLITTLLGYCIPGVRNNIRDFTAIRVAATYPNIVALPILIFPSLCEYSVVYQGFYEIPNKNDEATAADLIQECIAKSNSMIFCYFFSWSFIYWSVGNPQLLALAQNSTKNDTATDNSQDENDGKEELGGVESIGNVSDTIVEDRALPLTRTTTPESPSVFAMVCKSLRQTLTSSGFLAMIAGFITGCIPPLRDAMFETGGALRFLGSSLETLGQASNPLSTMVVAASLVPIHQQLSTANGTTASNDTEEEEQQQQHRQPEAAEEENPIMTDPNFGPYRRRRRSSVHDRISQSVRRGSSMLRSALKKTTPELRNLHVWFILSRLIVAPAIIVAIIIGMDCGGLLHTVPALSKLIVIVNSCLPGALIVVVVLKSHEELVDSAAAVAKVYLPSYLLSIVTIAAWTALGLWISLPDENGASFCH